MSGESAYWDWLRQGFEKGDHYHRVENLVRASAPDLEVCVRTTDMDGRPAEGVQFWAELKSSKRPLRETSALDFKVYEGQADWAKRRREAGGRCFLLIRVGFMSAPSISYLLDGKDASLIVTHDDTGARLAKAPAEGVLKELKLASWNHREPGTARMIVMAMAGMGSAFGVKLPA